MLSVLDSAAEPKVLPSAFSTVLLSIVNVPPPSTSAWPPGPLLPPVTTSLSSVTLKGGDQVPDIVASNIRPLIALGDTRLALLPVQLTVERQGARERARLRLVLVDGRGSTVLWVGEVLGDAVASGSDPLLFSSLVAKVAALVAPR